ncbi:glycosyltransferase [Candidatus Kaiserbacteria bacterium]|nr:glycosyltransferase [Candidatus Kaiserbacteria bacterium]
MGPRPTSNGVNLLIVTQTLDRTDPVLGFFHRWIEELSKHYERINVICLKEGAHSLPENVDVHSLGKEGGASRLKYVARLFRYIWKLRNEYDAVFVHMNQEYVLLAGLFWRLIGKRIYLWRNHYAGSMMTNLAVALSTKVFCTSRFSYTAKFRKTVLMPVGIDTNVFRPLDLPRKAGSILSLGRIAPSKHVDVLIEAVDILKQKSVDISARIFGDALPKDADYHASLLKRIEELGLTNIQFHAGVPNYETPKVYSAHDIFVNCSGSGMYDKTIFEAAACGALPLASSRDFSELAPDFSFAEGSSEELAAGIERLMSKLDGERESARASMRALAERHSLRELGVRLGNEIR